MPTKKWTEEEEDFLRENFVNMTNAELAEKFSITKNAVQKKLARMDLRRSEAANQDPVDKTQKVSAAKEEKTQTVIIEAHFSTGNKLFYEDRDYRQAIREYEQASVKGLDEFLRLKARYWMAECYVKMQKMEDAIGVFREIAEKYGSHYLGDSARRRVETLKDYI